MRKVFPFRLLRVLVPCFLVVFGTLFVVHPVFAQDTGILGEGLVAAAKVLGEGLVAAAKVNEYISTFLAYILNIIVWALGSISLVLIEALIVPILNYNSFSTSTVIGLGWSLVRDIVNMFVIIALLGIAVLTIIGNERAHWQQQLPRLFLAVVMVNFSRTICGLLIDVSQVVMFTFVNALLDIAAGNFAQLFSMNYLGKIDDITAATAASSVTEAASAHVFNGASNLMNAFLQVPLYGSIVAILILLALAFIYRIVVLWILVILSPAAFFMQGMHDVFHIGGAHAWWEKFTGALVMGPLLAFFLWLALAASSAGSITQTENFPTPETPSTYGLSLWALRSDNIVSTLLALVILVVGMQQAGAYASKLGDTAGQLISGGMGARVVTEAAKFLPVTVGGRVARTADRYAAPAGSLSLSGSIGKNIIGTGQKLATSDLGKIPGVSALASGIISAGGAVSMESESRVHGDIKARQERWAGLTDDQRNAELTLMATGRAPVFANIDAQKVAYASLATSTPQQKKLQKQLAAQGDDGTQFNAILADAIHHTVGEKDHLLDDAGKTKLEESMSRNLHLIGYDPTTKTGDYAQIKAFVESKDFVASKVSEEAISDSTVQRVLGEVKDRNVKEDVTYLARFEASKYGVKPKADVKKIGLDQVTPVPGAPAGSPRSVQAIETNVRNVLSTAAKVDIATLGDIDPANKATIANEFFTTVQNIANGPVLAAPEEQRLREGLASGVSNGSVDLSRVRNTDFNPATIGGQRMAQALVESSIMTLPTDEFVHRFAPPGSPAGTPPNPAALDAVRDAVSAIRVRGGVSVDKLATAETQILKATGNLAALEPQANPTTGTIATPAAKARVTQIIKKEPAVLQYLRPGVAGVSNDFTQVVVKNISRSDIEDIVKKAFETSNVAERAGYKLALETARDALDVERALLPAGKKKDAMDLLHNDALNAASTL